MTLRRGSIMLVQGGIIGLLIAVAVSGDDLISVQAWLAATVVWVVGRLLWEFISTASPQPAELVFAWSRRRRGRRALSGPSGLLAIGALLRNAQNNPRAYTNHLKPRLQALAQHHASIRHGIDVERDRDRVTALLGEVAWLIDPAVVDRSPTLAEIDRFLDVILAQKDESRPARRFPDQVATT
jgi:hypothetical protein